MGFSYGIVLTLIDRPDLWQHFQETQDLFSLVLSDSCPFGNRSSRNN